MPTSLQIHSFVRQATCGTSVLCQLLRYTLTVVDGKKNEFVKTKENIFVKFDILMTKWYIHSLSF
jgi:hypothetical protein